MEAVGTAEREDLGTGQTNQGQIPQQIQELMAHRFVGVAQGWVEPAVPVADQRVVKGAAADQAGGPQLLHLVAEAEGAGRGDLLHKGLGVSSSE